MNDEDTTMTTTNGTTASTITNGTPLGAPPLTELLLDQAVAGARARTPLPAHPAPDEGESAEPATWSELDQVDVSAIPAASIVVALDGSTFSHAALAPAVQMARCLSVPLAIVQATASAKDLFLEEDLKVECGETDARLSLHEAAAEARAQGLQVTEVLVTGTLAGSPARAILAAAAEFNARMIVLATHGRTGLSRVVHGSVAAEVVHGTDVPVLLVRP